ncbi:helix-turn-helix domain-containing protein [Thermus sp. NEB1569]|uniref:helix-turn-helix domain-containing protein n=1 Tax=Thermus sp. NEB1569 TaxID=2918899 RepID=UPI001EFC18DB|nr:helix-turn-helix transcriptional regulator [Thermus sp. NEB1569]ULR41372.1 helix-turn-helix domain-containing protein [Thermus sp. NEB1569]
MIGERLRELRLKRGLSQYELARAANVSQGLIWQIEAGRKTPRLKTLLRLAEALSVSPEELLPVVSKEETHA